MKLRLPKVRIAEARKSRKVREAGFSFGENAPDRDPMMDARGVPTTSDWATVEVTVPAHAATYSRGDIVGMLAALALSEPADPCDRCREYDPEDLAHCGGCDKRLDYEEKIYGS